MGTTRIRTVLVCVLVWLCAPSLANGAPWPVTLTDLAQRDVTVAAEPRRVFLAEGLQFLSLALVHEDPAGILALIGDDLKAFDPATYDNLVHHLPRLADVPTVGAGGGIGAGAVSLETVLAAEPDLVILSLWQKPGAAALLEQMGAAHVPVVFIDFFEKPRANTAESIRVLGKALGREARANAYAEFYEAHVEAVETALADVPERPKTFLQHFAGTWPCCWSAGSGSLGEFLDLAKAENIGAARLPTANGGNLNLEYVLTENPSLYITTGLGRSPGGIAIGSGVAAEDAKASLARLAGLPGVAATTAVREGHVHGLWNYFNGSPLNILAIEALARWAHPQASAGIDPAATLKEINQRFLAAPLVGTFWTSLDPSGEAASQP